MNYVEIIKTINPLLIAIITVFGTAAIKFYFDNKVLKSKNEVLREEIKDKSLEIQMDLQTLNDIKDVVEHMLSKTKADRFLILTATNGKTDLRFATAIYEHHKKSDKIVLSIGATGKYVKFEFDSEYKKMLKDVETHKMLNYDVSKIVDSDLQRIYNAEEITFSNVYFLLRSAIDQDNDRMFYCSVATHSEKNYTHSELVILKAAVDKLKFKLKDL
jgi:hypothetical protein